MMSNGFYIKRVLWAGGDECPSKGRKLTDLLFVRQSWMGNRCKIKSVGVGWIQVLRQPFGGRWEMC